MLRFLQGEGEMAARIRAFDWSTTPLGPPEAWPAPLRTVTRLALTTQHPVFVMWGPELRCLYNDAFRASLGPEQHPAMLGACAETAWAEIWPIIGSQVEQVMAGRGPTWHRDAMVSFRRHGEDRPIYWTYGYSPIDDPGAPNGVGGVLVLCNETTEQVLAAQRTKEAEARWQTLFDQAPDFMSVLDGPEHRYEYLNEACKRLIQRRDVVGRTVAEVIPELPAQGFVRLLDEAYASGKPFIGHDMPVRFQPAGEDSIRDHWIDFIYQPIRGDDGAVRGMFVQGHDVTEAYQAKQRLQGSEQRLRQVIDALYVFVAVLDGDGKVDEISHAPPEMPGVDRDAATGRPFWDCGWWSDDPQARQRIAAAFDSASGGAAVRYDEVYWAGGGAVRIVDLQMKPVHIDGCLRCVVASGTDVTERRRIETALREEDRRKDAFLATLSHELRNPLAPIRTAATLLALPNVSAEDQARAREIIKRQSGHMARLLDDLLDVARVTRGKLALRRSRVALRDVVEAALETSRPALTERRHALAVALPDEPLWLHADALRLAQVLTNLLTNAAKYTEPGGQIALTAAAQDARAVIRVRDNGMGIEAGALDSIFEMFTQLHAADGGVRGGLGIGLALVKGLVELHGGRVQAYSAGPGQGSEFVVTVPLTS